MTRYGILGLVAAFAFTSSANALVDFGVQGFTTDVTADIEFSYAYSDDSNATITVKLTNTTIDAGDTEGAFITAFGMNLAGGATFSTIAGDADDDPASQESTQYGATGWHSRLDPGEIHPPNGFANFDFGVMNHSTANAFITGGNGHEPKIDPGEMMTFTLGVTGSGLSGITEADFAIGDADLSGPWANFGVRFQGIGPDGDSDLAVVPVPPAMLLCALGLGTAGLGRLRRRS